MAAEDCGVKAGLSAAEVAAGFRAAGAAMRRESFGSTASDTCTPDNREAQTMNQELEDEAASESPHRCGPGCSQAVRDLEAAAAMFEHRQRRRAIRFVVFVAVVVMLISVGAGIR
jgi:hypothetical protein